MVRNRSCPAVSQICSFTRFPSSSIVRILKSIPMVVMKDGVNESSLKRSRQHDLPTPESPISSSLICPNGQCQYTLDRWRGYRATLPREPQSVRGRDSERALFTKKS